jgi:hypothetical protein
LRAYSNGDKRQCETGQSEQQPDQEVTALFIR